MKSFGDVHIKRIAVIGSLNIDYAATVDAAPARGETVLATGFHIAPGGKGANQAFAASRMGAPTAMFGAVGNDANGKALLDNLRVAGVDVSHVLIADVPTAVALITVTSDGDNSIVVAQNANLCVTAEYIDAHFAELKTYDIFLFQLEIPIATVTYTTEKQKTLGKNHYTRSRPRLRYAARYAAKERGLPQPQ